MHVYMSIWWGFNHPSVTMSNHSSPVNDGCFMWETYGTVSMCTIIRMTVELKWIALSYKSKYRLASIQHIVRCHLALDISHWRCSHKPVLFPSGSAEMPLVWNDGAGENAPLCCKEIALKHRGRLTHHCSRRRNIPPVRCIITTARLYLFTGVIALSEMNGLAHMDRSKWFGTAWMTLRLTLWADTSLSLCVISKEGRARCSPCICHAALVTIINLTRHLP